MCNNGNIYNRREYYCCSNYEEINNKCIMTITSNIAEIISSEESVTKVYEEEKDDGLSKTELLTLFCGALSGIIVILGFLGILNLLKKRACILKSKRDKPNEEVHISGEPEMQQAFALHESFYETIDDSHLESISVPQTCNLNPGNDNASQSSRSLTTYNDDRSSYLDPVSSLNTKKSSFRKEKQSKKTVPPAWRSTCLENQMAFNPNLESDGESAIFGCSTNCNDDRSKYLQPVSSLIVHDSSCQKEENSLNIDPSANKSTSIENQTSFSPYLEIDDKSSSSGNSTNCYNLTSIYIQPFDSLITKEQSRFNEVFRSENNSTCIADKTSCNPQVDIEEDDSDDSNSEFSGDATHDRSSYLHPYNTLFNKISSCHIYETCQNKPFSE
ncbi:Hypothetical predicted protein [Mytilus galloprovincialis]|uniref:Uncharacterized protein n=1 Tax=Mytilus galloprovincialis TaxID=29158 RepID=A0A8B6H1R1_MYTGA|nr:Hypothetical predicted protein [Mytilus galloprovincialis]